jgi:SAM-dependent methyltransferase
MSSDRQHPGAAILSRIDRLSNTLKNSFYSIEIINMSHPEQMEFVRLCREHLLSPLDKSFIEIGSYNVNVVGGGLRGLFSYAEDYVGVDLIEGPGVDRVASGHEVDFPNAFFDVALSCECFEHNPEWHATFLNMHRMTKPGGVMIITVATEARLEHGTTRTNPKSSPGTSAINWNYYRNLTESDFRENLPLAQLFAEYQFYKSWSSHDLYFWGIVGGGDGGRFVNEHAIAQGIPGMWQLRRDIMTPVGYTLRVSARMLLYGIYLFTPRERFQDIAVPYARICYGIASKLGLKLERSA